MNKIEVLKARRRRAKLRIRKKIFGVSQKPRLTVFRSNKFIYVQVIDDNTGNTLASASSMKLDKALNIDTCKLVGKDIADKLKGLKVETVVFDRNGYLYTGKIKALADSIRENGIKL